MEGVRERIFTWSLHPIVELRKICPASWLLISILSSVCVLWGVAKRPQGIEANSHTVCSPFLHPVISKWRISSETTQPSRFHIRTVEMSALPWISSTIFWFYFNLGLVAKFYILWKKIWKLSSSLKAVTSMSIIVPGNVGSTLHTWSHLRLVATLQVYYHYFSDRKLSWKVNSFSQSPLR